MRRRISRPSVLEHIRLLTNLETETQKLLQIILIGQPELRKLLAREDLRQLAQRITGRYHLDPLSREETAAYVRHRLRVAGATADIFTRGALREVYRVSGGIPRVINIICDRALLGAYTQDLHQVPAALVRRAGGRSVRPGADAALDAAGCIGAMAVGGARSAAPRCCGATAPVGRRLLTRSRRSPVAAGPPLLPRGRGARRSLAPRRWRRALPPAGLGRHAVGRGAPHAGRGARRRRADLSHTAPPPTFAQLLAMNRNSTDTDTAFAQLLGLWKAQLHRPARSMAAARRWHQGLRCLMQRGSLAQLRLLNRPAILMLQR